MIIFNLKIINPNTFIIKYLSIYLFNTENLSIVVNKLRTYPKRFCADEAFVFDIIRMIEGGNYCLAVYFQVSDFSALNKLILFTIIPKQIQKLAKRRSYFCKVPMCLIRIIHFMIAEVNITIVFSNM